MELEKSIKHKNKVKSQLISCQSHIKIMLHFLSEFYLSFYQNKSYYSHHIIPYSLLLNEFILS